MVQAFIVAVALLMPRTEVCLASQYAYDGDKLESGNAPGLGRPVRPTDWLVAHRTAPIRSWVRVTNLRTGRSVRVRVMDVGPFGRKYKKPRWAGPGKYKSWYNGAPHYRAAFRRAKKNGTRLADELPKGGWRGCLDMTPRVGRALGHNGLEEVMVIHER